MHGQEHFCHQLALNPTAIRFDYHVLYTGAVTTGSTGDLPSASSGECCAACYEHFSTVDGVALCSRPPWINDYSLCDRVGSSTNTCRSSPPPAADLQNHEYVVCPMGSDAVREAAYTWILERFAICWWIAIRTRISWILCRPPARRHRSAAPGGVPAVGASGTLQRCTRLGIRGTISHRHADRSASFSCSPDEVKAVTTDCVDKA